MVKINTKGCDLEILKDEKIYDLLHFRRALAEERYEVCEFWASQARKSGATPSEIHWHISLVLSGDPSALN